MVSWLKIPRHWLVGHKNKISFTSLTWPTIWIWVGMRELLWCVHGFCTFFTLCFFGTEDGSYEKVWECNTWSSHDLDVFLIGQFWSCQIIMDPYIIHHHTSYIIMYLICLKNCVLSCLFTCLFRLPNDVDQTHREAVVPKPMSTCQRHSFMSKCWERKGISPWKTKILNPKGMEVWFRWCSFSIGSFLGVHWFAGEYPSWN